MLAPIIWARGFNCNIGGWAVTAKYWQSYWRWIVIMMSTTLICSLQDKVDNHNYLCKSGANILAFQNEAQGHSNEGYPVQMYHVYYVDWKLKYWIVASLLLQCNTADCTLQLEVVLQWSKWLMPRISKLPAPHIMFCIWLELEPRDTGCKPQSHACTWSRDFDAHPSSIPTRHCLDPR